MQDLFSDSRDRVDLVSFAHNLFEVFLQPHVVWLRSPTDKRPAQVSVTVEAMRSHYRWGQYRPTLEETLELLKMGQIGGLGVVAASLKGQQGQLICIDIDSHKTPSGHAYEGAPVRDKILEKLGLSRSYPAYGPSMTKGRWHIWLQVNDLPKDAKKIKTEKFTDTCDVEVFSYAPYITISTSGDAEAVFKAASMKSLSWARVQETVRKPGCKPKKIAMSRQRLTGNGWDRDLIINLISDLAGAHRTSTKRINAPCPCHNSTKDGLWVNTDPGDPMYGHFGCHNHCDGLEILKAIGYPLKTNGQQVAKKSEGDEWPKEADDGTGRMVPVIWYPKKSRMLEEALFRLGIEIRGNIRLDRLEVKVPESLAPRVKPSYWPDENTWRDVPNKFWDKIRDEIETEFQTRDGRTKKKKGTRALKWQDADFYSRRDVLAWDLATDPVCDWVWKQKDAWTPDQPSLIDDFLQRYMGAPDTPLLRHANFVLWGSLVARAIDPGCKIDTSLILQGAQGGLKSTLVRCLLPAFMRDDYFTDSFQMKGDQKAMHDQTQGVVLCEMAELTGLSKVEQNYVKHYATQRAFSGRPAYRRDREFYKRCFIMVGTTNEEQPLPNDPTGSRRWCVVPTSTKMAYQELRDSLDREREIIVGEALFWLQNGKIPGFVSAKHRRWLEAHNTPFMQVAHDLSSAIEEIIEIGFSGPSEDRRAPESCSADFLANHGMPFHWWKRAIQYLTGSTNLRDYKVAAALRTHGCYARRQTIYDENGPKMRRRGVFWFSSKIQSG